MWLRETGRRHFIGAPKAELKKFSAALAAMDGWRTIRDGVEVKLARTHSHDVILPTSPYGEFCLRCITQLDAAQAALPGRLGIVLPKRMRLTELALPAVVAIA